MAKSPAWKQPFHKTRRLIAKFWLKFFPQLTIIGITGSYGKTNTTRAIAYVLSERFKTLQTKLNLDTVYNLPITLLKVRPWHQKLVLELGVDHVGEMASYLTLAKPLIGVLTGITPVHSEPELLGSLQGIIKEKGGLLEALPKKGLALLNYDDPHVRKMAKKTRAKVYWYGLSSKSDFWADEIKVGLKGTSFRLHYQKEKVGIKTGLVGRHFVQNCLAAAAVGRLQGLSWDEIKRGLAKLKPLKGRVSIERGPLGSVLINDALRANPASTIAGLQVLVDLPTKGKRIAVLGEMGELGTSAEKSHREIGREVRRLKIDCLVSVGPLQKFVAEEAKKGNLQVFWVENVHQAAEVLKKILKPGDLFYLKASLLRHMERILLILRGKKVGCRVTSCEHYGQCPTCPYLEKGLR